MSGKRILVTGGAGFIGSHLVDRLVEEGERVTVLDCLDSQVHPDGTPDYLNQDAEFVLGNILDRDLFADLIKKNEIIYHLASAVGVGQSQYQIDHYVQANTQGTARMLDILVNENHEIQKIIVAASMSSYGEGLYEGIDTGRKVRPGLRPESQLVAGEWELLDSASGEKLRPIPTPESEPFQESSIYAMTKAHQEEMVLNIGKIYNIPAVATRFFNVYGPRQSLSNPYTGVSAIFISRIKNDNPPVVYEDGKQSRDFISVHDVVTALMLLKQTDVLDYEAVNIGTGVPVPIADVARTIAKVCRKSIEPNIQNKFRKGDIRHCFADNTKLCEKLEWEPRVSFEEGIHEVVEWSDRVKAADRFDEAAVELKRRGLV
ncbi:MAG: GDP-mannose 4,6-dehydratase [Candidatus Omnitrophica bacterium]|nr:GDP-mannose 4,6-dehydratase [Candidatus Omnitrophota bacterium]